ncbi:MAG: hypothetical protein HZA48_07625 [Planctomycetes bacterium]|nr:hypothetical protein [Planctomycetota bacterium]
MRFILTVLSILTLALTLSAQEGPQENAPKILFEGDYLHRAGNNDLLTNKISLALDKDGIYSVSTQIDNDKFSLSFNKTAVIEYNCAGTNNSGFTLKAVFSPKLMSETRFAAGERISRTDYDVTTENAMPYLSSKPDPFCFTFFLVRQINATPETPQVLTVYDMDSAMRCVFDCKLIIKLEDENGISLPNGKFKAKHYSLIPAPDIKTQTKKNKPSRVDIWLDNNLNILRAYRYRDSYELILQDYANTEGLIDAAEKMVSYKPPAENGALQGNGLDEQKIEGEIIFKGTIKHVANNREIVKEKFCVKKQQDGSLVYIADMGKMAHTAWFDKNDSLIKYDIHLDNGNLVEHAFAKDTVKITLTDKELEYPVKEGTFPDFGIRPDPFLLQVSFLKKIDCAKNTSEEYTLFDRSRKSDSMCEYKVKIQKIGEEDFSVGNMKFKAFHLILEQLDNPETFVKRDKGAKMDLWITPEGIPVRFVRPSEKYEAILIEREK